MFAPAVGHQLSCGETVPYVRAGVVWTDVTGDGVADQGLLVRSRCGWSVELRAAGRVFRVKFRLPDYLNAATVRRAGNLDGRRGKELLVTADQSGDTVTYRVVTFAGGLRLMTGPGYLFREGLGGGYGTGFGCVRPGLVEQVSWGGAPFTVGRRQLFAARGLTWRFVSTAQVAIRTGVMPREVRHPFARCR